MNITPEMIEKVQTELFNEVANAVPFGYELLYACYEEAERTGRTPTDVIEQCARGLRNQKNNMENNNVHQPKSSN